MRKFSLSVFFLLFSFGLLAQENKLLQLSWLMGGWEQAVKGGKIIESWAMESKTLFSGVSYFADSNGVQQEEGEYVKLLLKDGVLWYMPTVYNQNNGKEVKFREKSFSANEVVFENPKHDFPQRICYQKRSDSTIHAYIEGKQNGKTKRVDFYYTRIKIAELRTDK